MPEVDALLDEMSRLADRIDAPTPPVAEVARRGRRLTRRRAARSAAVGATVVLLGAVATVVVTRDSGEGADVRTMPSAGGATAAPTPSSYLDEVLVAVEENAYYATPEMIETWQSQAEDVAEQASSTLDTYPFVNEIASQLDPNSRDTQGQGLWSPERVAAYETAESSPPLIDPPGPPSGEVQDGVGYLQLTPTREAPDSDAGAQYVAEVQAVLSEGACGWILDLRAAFADATSDLETMTSAAAPLLGTGEVLGIRSRDGATSGLVVDDDGALQRRPAGETVAPASETFEAVDTPVAILQGPGTTSSYEQLLIGFLGRPDVRRFGEPTAGQSAVREGFDLPDGSRLWLATAAVTDDEGVTYDGPIAPDVPVDVSATGADAARDAAAAWLAEQPSCQ